MTRRAIIVLSALCALLATPTLAQADFGFVPGSVKATALDRNGAVERQAGAHPYSYTVEFELKTDGSGQSEGGSMRDVIIDAPPGLVGNPNAIPSCPRQSFEGGIPNCLPSTQIGILKVFLPGVGSAIGPLYNLTPPPGVAAQFGFSSTGFVALQSATVRSETGYGVRVAATNLPIEATAVTATLWGAPADEGHTPQRGPETGTSEAKSNAPLLPYLTLPTACGSPPLLTVSADSVDNPGVFVSETAPAREEAGNPAPLIGCEAVPFDPSIGATPTTGAADSPAGLSFGLKLPNKGLLNPKDGAVTETEPEKLELDLPPGISVNPSSANGIAACTWEQFKAVSLTDQGCPDASKLGTLIAHTPLLDEAVEGSVYLAAPRDNPSGSFLAIYVVARVPERGVLIKQAAEVHADPVTGQLSTIATGLPPLPYSSIELKLREGPRAPLITPQTCGSYTTTAKLYPFSDPEAATVRTAPFTITSGAGGASCATSEAQLPLHPTLEAGTTAPLAGAYSPFLFRLSRSDGEQRLSQINATLPQGLAAKLAGVPYCPEAQIDAAKAREAEGGGAQELAAPSCPPDSRIGTATVAAGAGTNPYYVQGQIYLAGPYKGAPLSLAIVTPAVAGPFDLGAVVSRAGLYVDESTAIVTVKSDPIPTILKGIPLDVRSVEVNTDREGFTLNPTSCEVMAVTGEVKSTTGASAALSNRFQLGGCEGLGFKPALKIAFKGKTNRGSHPQLTATLTPREGDANVSFAQVKLPPTAFLDQAHIKTVCTRVQFAAEQCPAGSIYGTAEAMTPLLGYPLKGNVYLRSNGGERLLPDLVLAFKGPDSQPIKFTLVGKTDSVHQALRNTFETAPDAPVSSFRLKLFGGKKGLIVLTEGFCADRSALVRMRAHNGRAFTAKPKVQAACKQQQKKKKANRHKRGSGKR
ncbi:MAG TPA: hypothetical protein VF245_08605 [Solirubrobacterales bacterium]